MTNSKSKPAYRVMCARIEGRGEDGREQLGNFREIGTVWPAGEGKKWLPVPIDLWPVELSRNEARLFLAPVES